MKKLCILSIIGVLLFSLSFTNAKADWHDHDIHHFNEHDMGHWHGGSWNHGFHDGRDGWWWIVDGQWYAYPAPVYPYPDPYVPPVVVQQYAPTTPQYWYCANPTGYYPYVPQCTVEWQAVPYDAIPPAPAPAAPPQLSQRDMDDRQLNTFAVELDSIQVGQPDAAKRIKNLQKRVATFHQTLFERKYNAMDILNDTEHLEARVETRKVEILGE